MYSGSAHWPHGMTSNFCQTIRIASSLRNIATMLARLRNLPTGISAAGQQACAGSTVRLADQTRLTCLDSS